jgi:hypothetical protein
MKKVKKIIALLSFGAVALIAGCSKTNPQPEMSSSSSNAKLTQYAHMAVTLKERHGIIFSPAYPYTSVNLEISSIEARYMSDVGTEQWVKLQTNSGIYNLLALPNVMETVIASEPRLPIGQITAFRIRLGDQNSVIVGGDSQHPLIIPHQYDNGIKLEVGTSVSVGDEIKMKLVIDAFKSVVKDGDLFIFHPNLFVEGIIHADVEPDDGSTIE